MKDGQRCLPDVDSRASLRDDLGPSARWVDPRDALIVHPERYEIDYGNRLTVCEAEPQHDRLPFHPGIGRQSTDPKVAEAVADRAAAVELNGVQLVSVAAEYGICPSIDRRPADGLLVILEQRPGW